MNNFHLQYDIIEFTVSSRNITSIHHHADRHDSHVSSHRLCDRAQGGPGRDAQRQRSNVAVAVGGGVRIPKRTERCRPRGVRPGRGAPDARAGGVPGNGPPAPGAQLEESGRAAGRIRLRAGPFAHHPRPPVAPDRGHHRTQRQDRTSLLHQSTVLQVSARAAI